MIRNTIREALYKRLGILSAFTFALTLVLIAFRSHIGFGPILAAGLVSYLSAWLAFREVRRRGSRTLVSAVGYYGLAAIFLLWLLSFAFIEFHVVFDGRVNDEGHGEYAIVLGAGLNGRVPSVSLSSRLQRASEYLRENRSIKVIVSGGQGQGEDITEEEAMKSYLVDRGIEEARIIEESKATSTRENLMFSEDILEAFHTTRAQEITVITSDYHAFRTRLIGRSLGIKVAVLPAKTPLGIYISGCIREYFAVVHGYLFDGLGAL